MPSAACLFKVEDEHPEWLGPAPAATEGDSISGISAEGALEEGVSSATAGAPNDADVPEDLREYRIS